MPVILFVMLDGYISYNDTVAMTHISYNDTVAMTHISYNDTVAITHISYNDTVAMTHISYNDTVAMTHIAYNDAVAMTHCQVTFHQPQIPIFFVLSLYTNCNFAVKISVRLQFRHGEWFCSLVCHCLC